MRLGLLLFMVAAIIPAGCRSVSYQTADSAAVEPAVLSYQETELAEALSLFLRGRLLEEEYGQGARQALPFYQTATEKAPGSHTVYSRIAIEGMHRGDLDASISAMEASHAAQTNDPMRQIDLGAMYQLAYRLEEAADLYEKARMHQPTNTALYITLSDIYFTYAQDSKALELLADGFRQAEDAEALYTHLHQHVRRFVARNELSRAIDALEILAEQKYDPAETYFMIGELYIAQKAISDATSTFYRSIEFPNAPAAAYLRLAALLQEKDKSLEAVRIMRKGYDAYPDSISFPVALGSLHFDKKEYEDALCAYKDALRIFTEQAHQNDQIASYSPKNLLIAKATAQAQLQQLDDAAQTMQNVLDQTPDSHIAMNFLAYMWAELDKNLDEAYSLSQRSLEKDPDNGAYLDTLGWIYYRKERYDQALKYLRKAQEQLGPDPEVLLHIGDVYAALGDQKRARTYWKKSIQEDPTPENRARDQMKSLDMDPEKALEEENADQRSSDKVDQQTDITENTPAAGATQTRQNKQPQDDIPTETDTDTGDAD